MTDYYKSSAEETELGGLLLKMTFGICVFIIFFNLFMALCSDAFLNSENKADGVIACCAF